MRIRVRSVRLVLAVGLLACGGSNGSGPPPPPPPPPPPSPADCPANTFCMPPATNTFNPTSRGVASGTTVSWQNGSGTVHNVTFANPAAAGAVAGGAAGNITEHDSGTNSRVFTAAGTHNFQCTLHFGMTGSVIVQ